MQLTIGCYANKMGSSSLYSMYTSKTKFHLSQMDINLMFAPHYIPSDIENIHL